MRLDFVVMRCLQLFQSLAGAIVKYIIHGTGRKLKLFAGFNKWMVSYIKQEAVECLRKADFLHNV